MEVEKINTQQIHLLLSSIHLKFQLLKNLLAYIEARFKLTDQDVKHLEKHTTFMDVPAQTSLLEAGKVERYLYFLSSGIVKGYQNVDGKFVVQHLVAEHDFFTSLESFMTETPTLDYYETVTPCKLVKIAKSDFDLLQEKIPSWSVFVAKVTNDHLNCKQERVKDFQTLSAKERYLKFMKESPELALNVSVENIASFLGIEPQSLSRIRKQIAS